MTKDKIKEEIQKLEKSIKNRLIQLYHHGSDPEIINRISDDLDTIIAYTSDIDVISKRESKNESN